MKQNKRFLLVALVVLLAAVLAYGVAMATPATSFAFDSATIDHTLKLSTDEYGAAYDEMWIGPGYYTSDGDHFKWTSSDTTIAQVMDTSTAGSYGTYLRIFKDGKVTLTAQALDDDGKEIAGIKGSMEINVKIVKETSVTFSDSSVVITKGENVNIKNDYYGVKVTVLPADCSYGVDDLTWSTSDSKVAIVTNDGQVYGMKVGTATITATAKGDPKVSGSITVEVKDTAITSLAFSETALELVKGKTFPLNALLEKEGSGQVLYTSSDSSIVEVSTGGTITAVKAGDATITASSKKDPSIKAECKITVTDAPVTDITFSQEEYSIYKSDSYRKIGTFALVPADGNYENITFSSENPEIADAYWNSDYGYLNIYAIGNSVGTATISVSVRVDEKTVVTKSFKINVTEFAITSLKFTKTEYKLNLNKKTNIELGGRLIVKPDDYTWWKDTDDIENLIVWESSDDTIATVDASGTVYAHAPGKATITAKYSKDGAITASADVVIDTTPVKTFALSKKELKLTYNTYVNTEFYAQIKPADAYVKEIYYEVVDPEIVSISCNTYLNQPAGSSSSKVAYFDVYPLKAGTTDVKVYLDDGTTVHEAVLTVTVVKKEADLKIALADGEDESPISSLKLPLYKVASYNKRVAQLTAFDDNESYSSSEKFSVKWSSSNPSIATIDRYGRISVKKAGKVTITATTKDGTNKTATVEVQVIKNKIKKIKGTKNIAIRVGETNYLSKYLKIVPTKADLDLFDWTMTYKSSNDGVVSVNDDGTIVGVKQGTAKITVKANDGSKKKFTITVNVVPQMQ